MKRFWIFICMTALFLGLCTEFAMAKVKSSNIEFAASAKVGFVNVDFKGTGSSIESSDDKTFTVDLKKFTTQDKTRDKHFQEIFTAKSPNAVLVLDKFDGGKFSGQLTLNGVTKAVSGNAKVDGKKADCDFKINIHDFGVTDDQIKKVVLGVEVSKVNPEVTIKAGVLLE